ncbi:MAG: phosphatase PAP2 family protein [Acidimicrobiales bacterium]
MSSTIQFPWQNTGTDWLFWVNRFARHTPWLHGFMAAWALYGGLTALVILAGIGYILARRDSPGAVAASVWVGLAAVISLGANLVVSNFVGRPRPFVPHPGLLVLVGKTHDYSFPSDHASIAGAIAVGLFAVGRRRLAILAVVIAVTLAFGRVYVGVHYPSDVLAGLVLGGLIAGLGGMAVRPVLSMGAESLGRTRLRFAVADPGRSLPRRSPRKAARR